MLPGIISGCCLSRICLSFADSFDTRPFLYQRVQSPSRIYLYNAPPKPLSPNQKMGKPTKLEYVLLDTILIHKIPVFLEQDPILLPHRTAPTVEQTSWIPTAQSFRDGKSARSEMENQLVTSETYPCIGNGNCNFLETSSNSMRFSRVENPDQ
jgi:hypothetical protein